MHVGAVKEPALAAAPPAATLPRGGNLERMDQLFLEWVMMLSGGDDARSQVCIIFNMNVTVYI